MDAHKNKMDAAVPVTTARAHSALLRPALVTALLLIPCFWAASIPSSDLPSHLYSAWLAPQVAAGRWPGLEFSPQAINILADRLLALLLPALGPYWTEHVMASLTVAAFFWGAFAWLSRVTRRAASDLPWEWTPVLAMLSYGAIFYFGFLNFLLSTAASLGLLALLWESPLPKQEPRRWLAIPFALLALLAHPLPLAWAAGVLCYRWCYHWIGDSNRRSPLLLLLAGGLGLVLLRLTLDALYDTRSVWHQQSPLALIMGALGPGQFWVFGPKYLWIGVAALLLAAPLLLHSLFTEHSLLGHLALLHAAAFLILPATIQFPQYRHVLAFIPERLSLYAALAVCALLASSLKPRKVLLLSVPLAAVYFSFLYVDSRAYASLESEVRVLMQTLPPGQRVIANIQDRDAAVPALLHVADRACLGRCLSYGHYEPATGQFQVRATGPNGAVAWNMDQIEQIEMGRFIARDPGLYSVCMEGDRLALHLMNIGEINCLLEGEITPRWWSQSGWTSSTTSGGGNSSGSARVALQRKNQAQVPDHQGGVPVIDQADHMRSPRPHTETAKE